MPTTRRISHTLIACALAGVAFRILGWDLRLVFAAGVIFYLLDPFGPERGGFGTHGDDDFHTGG